MTAALRTQIAELAGRALRGRPLRQPVATETPEAPEPPAPDEIAAAKSTLASFVSRLRQLSDARSEFDHAVTAERGVPKTSAADALARGEEPLDAGEVLNRRARAEIRLRGYWELAQREAGPAMFALHAVRCDAAAAVNQAGEVAAQTVEASLPEFFDGPSRKRAIAEARPIKEAARATQAVEYLARYRIPAMRAEFGLGWRLPGYRITPLPEKGMTSPDSFFPSETVEEIEQILRGHEAALQFLAAMLFDPNSATWTA